MKNKLYLRTPKSCGKFWEKLRKVALKVAENRKSCGESEKLRRIGKIAIFVAKSRKQLSGVLSYIILSIIIYYINVKFCLYVLYTNQQFVILSYQTLHTLYYYPNLNFSNIFKFFKPPCHGQGSKNPLVSYISASSECIIFPSLTLPFT